MDEFIRKLLFKLSETYQPSIVTVTFFDEKKKRVCNVIHFILATKGKEKIYQAKCNGKRELIKEMIKWLN